MRTALIILFLMWGIGGFLFSGINFIAMPSNVGVGTSAYVAAGILYWIAGMMLFGIGALLAPRKSKDGEPHVGG